MTDGLLQPGHSCWKSSNPSMETMYAATSRQPYKPRHSFKQTQERRWHWWCSLRYSGPLELALGRVWARSRHWSFQVSSGTLRNGGTWSPRAAARAALRCRKNCSYRLVHSRATHYLKTGTICQDFVLLPFELGPEYFLGESEVRRFIHQLWLTNIWIGHSLIRTINLCFHKMSLQKKQRAWIFNDWFLLNS